MRIEVGKSYIDAEPYAEGETSFTDIITIMGEVLPGTMEYDQGYRFFSQHSLFYTPEGETLLECDCGSTHSVGRQLTPKDLQDGYTERYQIDINKCDSDLNYITKDHPLFRLSLGNVYVNRMGFLVLLDEIVHREDGEMLFASDSRTPWLYPNGSPSLEDKTMFDLIYQKK